MMLVYLFVLLKRQLQSSYSYFYFNGLAHRTLLFTDFNLILIYRGVAQNFNSPIKYVICWILSLY